METKKYYRALLVAGFTGGVIGALMVLLAAPVLSLNFGSSSGEFRVPFVSQGENETRIVAAVERANPAVVSITISKDVPVVERYYGSPNPFDNFFGIPFNFPQLRQNGTERREIGGGSGFLVSSSGHIVTNKHVVSDEDAEYTVYTNDGKTHQAKVIARDPALDIALLKIAGQNFPYLEFGNSDGLRVGQSAIAIGNALGEFRNTVSVGVVSGLSRTVVAGDTFGNVESLDEVIQTDAAINRGNSGGPLLNLNGQVVGVNVAVAAGSENIGFALPANLVKSAVESVQKTGKIIRPYIGVRYQPVTADLKLKNNLPYDYGVLVTRGQTNDELAVIPGSPADRAGIVENDIILEVEGVKLDDGTRLATEIRKKVVGDTITLKIWHRGAVKNVSVKLEAMPQS